MGGAQCVHVRGGGGGAAGAAPPHLRRRRRRRLQRPLRRGEQEPPPFHTTRTRPWTIHKMYGVRSYGLPSMTNRLQSTVLLSMDYGLARSMVYGLWSTV